MARGDTQLEALENLTLELRRGALAMAALAALEREQYGYSLKRVLAESGLNIDEGTLYPLLRRLESQGLLNSRWVIEDGRPRRYYKRSAQGKAVLAALADEWQRLSQALESVTHARERK
jgi:PadR family transcriptional regulator PadR